MYRGPRNHAVVECLHPLFSTFGVPFGVRRGDVEKCFAVSGLEGARSIHGSFGCCPLEWRRGFEYWRLPGGYPDNLLFFDELSQARKSVVKRLQELIWSGMLVLQTGDHLQDRALWVNPRCNFLQCLLILVQVFVSHRQQAIE